MGLIARSIEAAGVPTLCMTSALSITRAVRPPRAAFLDYPLGHTTGKPHEPALQRAILLDALTGFASIREREGIVDLGRSWSDDDGWKNGVMRAGTPGSDRAEAESQRDDRAPRDPNPQYQTERDRELAEAALAAGGCPTCVFLEDRRR